MVGTRRRGCCHILHIGGAKPIGRRPCEDEIRSTAIDHRSQQDTVTETETAVWLNNINHQHIRNHHFNIHTAGIVATVRNGNCHCLVLVYLCIRHRCLLNADLVDRSTVIVDYV